MSANTNSIQQLYVAYFGRPADVTGLAYWETQVALAGGSTAAVSAAFAASAEYTATFAGLSNDQIVNTIYNNLFHRSPEPDGLIFWSNLLTGGKINISNVVTQIAAGAQGTDSVALAQKVAASVAFTAGLDTTDKILSYNGSAAVTIAKGWLAGIYDVATETAAVLPAALNATIASLPAGGTPGTTYTLTTGVDNFTGTANDDIFNAADSAATATWTALDKINGGTGNNTLNVSTASAISLPSGATVTNIQTANLTSTAAGGIVLNTTSGWSGLTAISATASGAGSPLTLTAAATTDITAIGSGSGIAVTAINGGKNISVTQTGTDGGVAVLLGAISVGGTTAAAGTVNVIATETYSHASSAPSNITVTGGTAVTVNSTVNAALAIAAYDTNPTAGRTGKITVTSPTGAVNITSETHVTGTSALGTVTGETIAVTGGTSVTVNQTASVVQTATALSTVAQGAVTVTGTALTTAVTINEAAASPGVAIAIAAVAEIAGVKAVTPAVAAAAGTEAVTAVTGVNYTPAVVAQAASPIITNGAVTITDKNAASGTLANTIASVTLQNYGATTINSNALTNLTLGGVGVGAVTITNAATTPTNTTLNLTLNGTKTNSLTGGNVGINSWYPAFGGANAVLEATAVNSIIDTNNEIKTIAVTLNGDSYLSRITDTALKTLTLAGTGVLQFGSSVADYTALAGITSISLSGAAGLSTSGHHAGTGLAALGAALTISTTSSGTVTATLDATTQTFVGSTGRDIITISGIADPTKVITGGSSTNDVLILDGGNSPDNTTSLFTAAGAGAKVTGFEVLGVTNTLSNVDFSKLSAGFTSIEVGIDGISRDNTNVARYTAASETIAAATALADIDTAFGGGGAGQKNLTLTNVAANTVLTFDQGSTGTTTYRLAATGGSTKSVTVNLGTATTKGVTFGTLALQGGNGAVDGIGTVSLVSNGLDFTAASSTPNTNTVTALTDTGLKNLNVSGTQGLTISDITVTGDTLAIGNTNTGHAGLVITSLSDSSLGNLTFTGTGNNVITTLADTIPNLTIANNGPGTAAITNTFTSATLQNLTLTGNVGLTLVDTYAGTTIAAGTDNAHLNITLGTGTNSVTVGNANNVIVGGTGVDTITVGTGRNLITGLDGADVISFGTHTAGNNIVYTTAASSVSATGANVDVLNNFNTTVDKIQLTAGGLGALLSGITLTAGTTSAATMLSAITDTTSVATIGNVYTQLATDLLNSTVGHEFAASANTALGLVAREVIFTTGAAAGTYLVINDNTAAFQGTADLVIKLVGTTTVAAGDIIVHA